MTMLTEPKLHSMTDSQWAAYSRTTERNRDIDAHRSRRRLEEELAGLAISPRRRSAEYPARVLAIAVDALRIIERAELEHGLHVSPSVAQAIGRRLLAEAGIEIDEFSP